MLNKKDPLIDAIQQVMQSNQADRDAVKAVNEKFGIQDRRVLPRERQGEWDAAYKTVLSEEMSPDQKKLAAVGKKVDPENNPNEIDAEDLEGARKGHASHIKEAEKMKGDDPCWKNYKMVGMKKKGGKPVPNCVPVKEQMTDPYAEGQASSITTVKPKTSAPAEPKPVNQGDQSKLTSMIKNIKEAKKAAMCEDTLEEKAVSKAQQRFMGLVRGIQKGKAKGSPEAKKAAETMSAKEVKKFAGTKQKGLPEKKLKKLEEAQTVAGGKTSLPPGVSTLPKPQTSAPGKGSLPTGTTSVNNNAPSAPAVRPSIVAKNSYTGAQTSTGAQVGGAKPEAVSKNLPSQKPYQSGAGAMTNPTQRPYDAKTSPTAKAPATAGSKVVKPVRKQPNAGTAKPTSGGVPARPARKSTVLGRVGRARRIDKNNDVGPGNS